MFSVIFHIFSTSLPTLCLLPVCCHIVSVIYVFQSDCWTAGLQIKPMPGTNLVFFTLCLKKKNRALVVMHEENGPSYDIHSLVTQILEQDTVSDVFNLVMEGATFVLIGP